MYAGYTKEVEKTMREKNIIPTDILKTLSEDKLKEIGLGKWGDLENHGGKMLWLLPKKYYDHIIQGTELIDINGNAEVFKIGITEEDTRFGFLPYGIIRE